VFVDGEKTVTLKGDHIAEEFQAIVEAYVQKNYAEGGKLRPAPAQKIIPIQAVNS
jgi:(E)-4-hydroxy-3-methylbut-2-enyl-diphosphate synthase